ncbi:HET domain-containing protein [Fusarium sp. LHS14.1]|nr:HET domain-containing protein [Fusarium sp. LHS14.1]
MAGLSAATACTTCHSLVLGDEYMNEGLKLALSDLRESAIKTHACAACALLWNAVSAALKQETSKPHVLYESMLIEHKPPKHPGPMVVHLYPDPVTYGVTEKVLQLYTLEGEVPAPWDLIGRGFHIPEYGLSPSCVALAREWLDMCVNATGKHANCTKATAPVLPTRVIAVGDDQVPPRLVITDPDQQAYYAALSHCWGGSTPTKTITSNVEDYASSLPADLPKTFIDAIKVARVLEIPYLWIDSLCIIQDSAEDWKHEASRMAQVYANAYVTIFADAAPDSTSGFLDAPSRDATPRFNVPFKTQDLEEGVLHIRSRGFLAEELPYHAWTTKGGKGRSKLSTRGWVFQERLLSPRTLHFSSNEMAWECRSVCECECSATSLRTLRTTSVIKHYLYPQSIDVSKVQASWRSDIVPAYTQLNLTFSTDRLPAIEGLANAAGKLRSDDKYVFGLWRNSIKADLMWHIPRSGRPSDRIVNGGAPTWSWASVTGEAAYNTKKLAEDSDLAILDVITGKGNPPTLLVRGHLVEVELSDSVWGNPRAYLGPDDELAVLWDVHGLGKKFAHPFFLVCGADGNGPFGLLLVAGLSADTSKQFRRVGYIPGYRITTRRRSWWSGGWVSQGESVSDESVEEMSDEMWEQANEAGAVEWAKEVFMGEDTTFKII